jgi:biopolymer transport protein ExbB
MNFGNIAGGPVTWVLLLLGVVSVLVFINRLFLMRRSHVDYSDFIRGIENSLERGNADEALAVCDETAAPVARVVSAAIRHRSSTPRALVEAVDSAGRTEIHRIDRRLALIAIIAQSAPLLGLFGTICGLMRIIIALATDSPVMRIDILNGAMQALVCTAVGLLEAVIVQIMYGILRVRLDRLVSEVEAAASEITALITSRRSKFKAEAEGTEA